MDESWYIVEQLMREQLSEARAAARSRGLVREAVPPHRARYAVGVGLIRLGSWVLTHGIRLPADVVRTLGAFRAATDRALRT
jgi:hypothetical protein